MASCEIQITNTSVLSRIESFMNDTAYREAIENSANYNTRLCIERRLRMPFIDPQTGVAQNHSNLFMSPRQRLPGLADGQVYTYPSKRWRKKRRQYLMQIMAPRRKEVDLEGSDLHAISTVENPAITHNEDSKDSSGIKDDSTAKVSQDAWFYDELDLQAMDGFDDPDPDSDYDYEETYTKRKKRNRPGPKPQRGSQASDSATKKPKTPGTGRGRKKCINYAADPNDTDKPFGCDLCGARYKTRPGLTYHYTHSHKEGKSSTGGGVVTGDEEASSEAAPLTPPATQEKSAPQENPAGGGSGKKSSRSSANLGLSAVQPPPLPNPCVATPVISIPDIEEIAPVTPPAPQVEKKLLAEEHPMPILTMEQNEKERATPSPYCDFCLGNAVANKKSGQPEELVSCSDCGRSGHPTCLQFTANMIISVRKYRWQCIECKCCSICGTSDNDDQLLFCDDCDRGYHMYCLAPPLTSPPEGSWSCRLCLLEFHK